MIRREIWDMIKVYHPTILVMLAIFLTSCATPEPRIVTRTVSVPIATPCAVSPGPEPAPIWTPEAIAASPNLYSLGLTLYAAYLQSEARNGELRAALSGCRE